MRDKEAQKTRKIIVPELEEAARIYVPKQRDWTDEEKATVREYYGRVPIQKLAGYLKRSTTGIQQMAVRLGISKSTGGAK